MTRMTRLQGSHPFLNKKFKHFSRIPMEVLSLPFLVLPEHDCNFNFYCEGIFEFAPLST